MCMQLYPGPAHMPSRRWLGSHINVRGPLSVRGLERQTLQAHVILVLGC